MPLEDILDAERWPLPAGLELRQVPAAEGREPTFELVDRGGLRASEGAIFGVTAVSAAFLPLVVFAGWVPLAGFAAARWRRRAGRGDVLVSVRADQLRVSGGAPISFDHITQVQAVGTIHRELWIRCGTHVVKHSGRREHVEFLARWLDSLRREAEVARAIRERRWLPP